MMFPYVIIAQRSHANRPSANHFHRPRHRFIPLRRRRDHSLREDECPAVEHVDQQRGARALQRHAAQLHRAQEERLLLWGNAVQQHSEVLDIAALRGRGQVLHPASATAAAEVERLGGAVDPAKPREKTGADGERAALAGLGMSGDRGSHQAVDDSDVLRTVLEVGLDRDADLHQHAQRGRWHSEKVVGYNVVFEQERLVHLIAEVEYHIMVFVILLKIRRNDFSRIVVHCTIGVLRPSGESHSYALQGDGTDTDHIVCNIRHIFRSSGNHFFHHIRRVCSDYG